MVLLINGRAARILLRLVKDIDKIHSRIISTNTSEVLCQESQSPNTHRVIRTSL